MYNFVHFQTQTETGIMVMVYYQPSYRRQEPNVDQGTNQIKSTESSTMEQGNNRKALQHLTDVIKMLCRILLGTHGGVKGHGN